MEWQPIETAPKDGSDILIYQKDEFQPKGYLIYVCFYHEGWIEAAGECYSMFKPTHWMPLPEPPKEN